MLILRENYDFPSTPCETKTTGGSSFHPRSSSVILNFHLLSRFFLSCFVTESDQFLFFSCANHIVQHLVHIIKVRCPLDTFLNSLI